MTRVARLTHDQYNATVQDLFGITDTPADAFAPDALNGFGFDTSIDLRVDARLGPQYRTAAEALAERARAGIRQDLRALRAFVEAHGSFVELPV